MLLGPSKAVLSGTLAKAGEANGDGSAADEAAESAPAPSDGAEPESPAA
jgi:hypothetical protein